MRPKLPPGPPVERDAPKNTSTAGNAKFLMCPNRSNSSVAGCRRCSDGIAGFRWQQMLADAQGPAVLEAFELHLRVVGARRIDHELAKAVAALERPLCHVDVLHARLRDI